MRRLLLSLVLVLMAVSAVGAQDEDGLYTSPDGLFSVPVPTNWTVAETDGYAILTDPDDLIRVYALTVETDDLTQAVDESIRAILPDFELELDGADITELPPEPGVEQMVIITYAFNPSTDTTIYQGLAQLVDGRAYLMIFEADLGAAGRRQSQINVIASGFTINALDQIDLSAVAPLPIDADIIAELEDFITYAMEVGEVPGAAVAIVQNGEVVYMNGFGVREMGMDAPMTPETLLMIGSTAKTFTTLYLAQLVDEGIITWDTPVVDILPSFALADADITESITVRNMMCACIGVPRRDLELIFNANEQSAAGIIASLADYQLFTDFGEAFQYSNQLIAAGGYIGALATGGTLEDAADRYVSEIQTRILEPIGMTNSGFDFETAEASADVATPHGVNLDFEFYPISLDLERFVIPVLPAGGLWSSAADMSQYLLTMMQTGIAPDGTRIVSEENLLEIWQPQVSVSAQMNYGLGWFVDEYKGLRLLHHGGNMFGFTSDLAFLPSADVGIVVLTNARGTNYFNEGVRTRLFELVFQQEADTLRGFEFLVERTEQSVTNANISAALDLDFFADFVGSYANTELGVVDVYIDGEAVIMDAGEFTMQVRAELDADGNLAGYIFYEVPLPGLPIVFEFDADGTPQLVIDIVTDRYVFTRID